MKAIGKYILIREGKIKERENALGLLVTAVDEEKERYKVGKVVLVGTLVDGIAIDDELYYDSAQGHNVTINDEVLRLIQERDVALIV